LSPRHHFSKYRFQELYSLLNTNLLTESWKKLNKKAAPGVDGTTADDYAQNLECNIRTIVDDLKNKRYHAKLVKRVYIPKDGICSLDIVRKHQARLHIGF
jgi:retron-type reverse transcriptase